MTKEVSVDADSVWIFFLILQEIDYELSKGFRREKKQKKRVKREAFAFEW